MDKAKLKKNFRLIAFLTTVSLVILLCLFILFSFVVLFSNFSPTIVNKLTTIVGGFGIFISVYVVSKIVNRRGIFLGLGFGSVVSFIIFVATLVSTGVIISVAEFIKIIIVMISACLGGILGANSRSE